MSRCARLPIRWDDCSTAPPAARAPGTASAGAVAPASPGRVGRVALVDDDPQVRAALAQYLQQAGLGVATFERGADLLRAQEREMADVVITDLLMPDTDGMELLMALRKRRPGAKVIVISGGDVRMQPAMVAARHLGAVAILWKPFELSDLLLAVRAALAMPPAALAEPREPYDGASPG